MNDVDFWYFLISMLLTIIGLTIIDLRRRRR
jgi:hypothetical protein